MRRWKKRAASERKGGKKEKTSALQCVQWTKRAKANRRWTSVYIGYRTSQAGSETEDPCGKCRRSRHWRSFESAFVAEFWKCICEGVWILKQTSSPNPIWNHSLRNTFFSPPPSQPSHLPTLPTHRSRVGYCRHRNFRFLPWRTDLSLNWHSVVLSVPSLNWHCVVLSVPSLNW